MVVLEKGAIVMVAAAASAITMYVLGRKAGTSADRELDEDYATPGRLLQYRSDRSDGVSKSLQPSRVMVKRVPVDEEANFLPYVEEIEPISETPSLSRGAGKAEEGGRRLVNDAERTAGRATERLGTQADRVLQSAERAVGRVVEKGERAGGRIAEDVDRAWTDTERRVERGLGKIEEQAEGTRSWLGRLWGNRSAKVEGWDRADLGDPAIARFQQGEVEENKRVGTLESRARSEHEEAERARRVAEKSAAEAAAAFAAATAFDAKRKEDHERAVRAREEAQLLERAASDKAREARDADLLSHKDDKYRSQAEADAQARLKEEERALRETARYEEKARADQRAAEGERLGMAETRRKDAAAAAAAAASARERADGELQREQAAGEEARRNAADVERKMREAEALQARATQRQAELAAREKELEAEAAAVRRQRREAEAASNSAIQSREETARQSATVRAAVKAHEEAARAAALARARAEELRGKAEEQERRSSGVVDKLRGWFSAESEKPVAATATATGSARSAPTVGTGPQSEQGRQVMATGAAKVDVGDDTSKGRERSRISREYSGETGTASTRVQERSRAS